MHATQSWQKLIIQAFDEIKAPADRCGLLCLYSYIYQALNHAGIANRSPFNCWQILRIHLQAKGNGTVMRTLCQQALLQMDKPKPGFYSNSLLSEYLAVSLLLIALIPQTATTFRSPLNSVSILQLKPQPMEDLDSFNMSLPYHSDYQFAANQFLDQPVIYERDHGLFGRDWIRHQQDRHYSLQLISTSNPDNLIAFCEKHNICSDSAYYASRVKGKHVYRLVYGCFDSHQAALLAKAKLSASLQQLKPWARQFKQIKSELVAKLSLQRTAVIDTIRNQG